MRKSLQVYFKPEVWKLSNTSSYFVTCTRCSDCNAWMFNYEKEREKGKNNKDKYLQSREKKISSLVRINFCHSKISSAIYSSAVVERNFDKTVHPLPPLSYSWSLHQHCNSKQNSRVTFIYVIYLSPLAPFSSRPPQFTSLTNKETHRDKLQFLQRHPETL